MTYINQITLPELERVSLVVDDENDFGGGKRMAEERGHWWGGDRVEASARGAERKFRGTPIS
jgi:hypothetical protein